MHKYKYTLHGRNKWGFPASKSYTLYNQESEQNGYLTARSVFETDGYKMSSCVIEDLDWELKMNKRKGLC